MVIWGKIVSHLGHVAYAYRLARVNRQKTAKKLNPNVLLLLFTLMLPFG